jgi:uncharacterized RDD family membrane protein YckC
MCQQDFAGRRQGSFFVDFVIFSFVSFIIYCGLSSLLAPSSGAGLRAYEPVAFLGGMLAFTAALLLRDGVGGRSPGKALNALRVVRRDSNRPIGFAESAVRNVPLLLPMLMLMAAPWWGSLWLLAPVPLVVMGFCLQIGPRPGDGWAGTKVILNRFAHHSVFAGRSNCKRCGYNLRGNTSGVCPECGSSLSGANRAALGHFDQCAAPADREGAHGQNLAA